MVGSGQKSKSAGMATLSCDELASSLLPSQHKEGDSSADKQQFVSGSLVQRTEPNLKGSCSASVKEGSLTFQKDSSPKPHSTLCQVPSKVMEVEAVVSVGSDGQREESKATMDEVNKHEQANWSSPGLACKQLEGNKDRRESSKQGFKEDLDELATVQQELEAMCTPCNALFECSVAFGGYTGSQRKRAKGRRPKQTLGAGVLLTFEWLQGEDVDSLHQITQYFRNKLQQDKLL